MFDYYNTLAWIQEKVKTLIQLSVNQFMTTDSAYRQLSWTFVPSEKKGKKVALFNLSKHHQIHLALHGKIYGSLKQPYSL